MASKSGKKAIKRSESAWSKKMKARKIRKDRRRGVTPQQKAGE